jgi:hypothetical protein
MAERNDDATHAPLWRSNDSARICYAADS